MADEQFALTREGYERLQEQLRAYQQERERMRQLIGDIQDDEGGNLDAEDAGAFFDVWTDMERADERIGHIQFVLERAVVNEEDPNPRRVDPGERVVVWDFADKRERTFTVLASPEVELTYTRVEGQQQVSTESPVGQALVGRRIGDIIEVEIPDGKARYAIRRIERL